MLPTDHPPLLPHTCNVNQALCLSALPSARKNLSKVKGTMWNKPSSSVKKHFKKTGRECLICDFSPTPEPTVPLKAKICPNIHPLNSKFRKASLET